MKQYEDSFRSVCTNAHLEMTNIIEIIIEMWLLGFRDEAKKKQVTVNTKTEVQLCLYYFGEKFIEIMKKNNLANKNYSSLTFKVESGISLVEYKVSNNTCRYFYAIEWTIVL